MTAPATDFAAAITSLRTYITDLCTDTGTWEDLIPALHAIQQAKTTLRDCEGLLTDSIVERHGRRPINQVVDGLGLVSAYQSRASEKWDGKSLGHEIAERTAAQIADDPAMFYDPDTGERLPPAVTIEKVAILVAEAVVDSAGLDAPSKGWRAGSLRARGINPKEFRASDPGRWNVKVTPGIVSPA